MVAANLPAAMAACVLATICACGHTDRVPSGSDQVAFKVKEESSMESIKNPLYSDDSIRLSVITNGCTSASDFDVQHSINNGRCELTIVRAQPDFCRKASSLIDIELAWVLPSDCSGMDVVFLNPAIGKFEEKFQRQLRKKKPVDE